MFKTIALTVTTPVRLDTLLGIAQTHADHGVALQAPVGNAGDIFFGDSSQQPAFVPAGGSTDVLPVNRLSDLYIKGTIGDNVIVMVF